MKTIALCIVPALLWLGCAASSSVIEQGQVGASLSTHAARATALKAASPLPSRSLSLDIADVDDIMPVPGVGILVAMTGMQTNYFGLYRGPLAMIDDNCSRIIWSYSRPEGLATQFNVILIDPVVLLRFSGPDGPSSGAGKSQYVALDPRTGIEQWQFESDQHETYILNAERSRLASASCDDGTVELTVLDIQSGKTLWSLEIEDDNPGTQRPSLLWEDEQLVIVGTSASGIGKGRVIWSIKGVGPVPLGSYPVKTQHGIIVPSCDNSITYIADEGKQIWRTDIRDSIGIISTSQNSVFIQQILPSGNECVKCLSLASGKICWASALAGHLSSQLLLMDERLAFTSRTSAKETRLFVLDAISGGNRICVPIQGTSEEPEPTLPDRLVATSQGIVVARERGIGQYSLSNGRCEWYHQVPGQRLTYAATLENMGRTMNRLGLGTWNPMEPKEPKYLLNPSLNLACQIASTPVSVALSHQQFVYQSTRSVLQSRTSTRDQRVAAHEQRIGSINQVIAAMRVQQDMERRQSLAAFGNAAMALGFSLAQGIADARTRNLVAGAAARMRQFQQLHARSLSGNYYVRPFGLEDIGNGVLLVDIRDGSWCEFMVAPSGGVEQWILLNCPLAAITDDESHLVVSGAGLDTTRWKTTFSFFGYPYPSTSVQSFDLSRLRFSPASSYATMHTTGYVNAAGKLAFPASFEEAGPFTEGYARAKANGHWGYIDHSGNFVVPARYESSLDVSQGLGWVRTDGKWGAVDMKGSKVISEKFEKAGRFSEGLAPVLSGEKWGYVDMKGIMVVPPTYAAAWPFHDGRGRVVIGSKFGFIDRAGGLVIPATFALADDFSEGFAVVRGDDDWGAITTSGTIAISESFRLLFAFHCGLSAYMSLDIWLGKGLQYGYIDKNGDKVIGASYQSVSPFHEGFANVQNEFLHGYIRTDGSLAIPVELAAGDEWAHFDSDGNDWVHDGRVRTSHFGLFGYIDTTGAVVIPPRFLEASHFSEGLAAVRVMRGRDTGPGADTGGPPDHD